MADIKITLPDGSEKTFPSGVTGVEIAKSISGRLAKEAIALKVDGQVYDVWRPLEQDVEVQILTWNDREGKEVFWHSSAHIMAQAVLELYPEAKLAIGPPIDEGFYYDFDVETPFSPEDLAKIEKKMGELIKENATFSREECDRDELLKKYKAEGEIYKVELIEDLPEGEALTVYKHSQFEDLCRGPHIPSIKRIKAFKLLTSSGAYWRGSEDNKMLQRIYGVTFPKKKMLDEHLEKLAEAERRDHRKLGKQLELYQISEETGAGLVLWLPKGAAIRNEIENFWREEHFKGDYELVYSPHIAKLDLWHKSGHTDFYSEDMFSPMKVDKGEYQIRPMNCPFHITMYKSRRRSYRELPIRWAELGTVYRYERAGVLHGLMRVRGFTQDDAHLFVRPEQMEDELIRLIDFSIHMLKSFGFSEFDIYLSTRPEKAIGEVEDWDKAQNGLRKALEFLKLAYEVDEGGGAFYGPKIDIKIKDALGRSWQCSTIQFDFTQPERFDLTYIDSDGERKRPLMIHRALLGSLERFFGTLIEHYAGDFPLWLAPEQARILPVTDRVLEYASELKKKFRAAGLRVELDDRSEKIGYKIRESELSKVPIMIIVGDKEVESKSVSIRRRGLGDLGALDADELLSGMKDEVARRLNVPMVGKNKEEVA
ncbi:MAG: threonine--tRNA ligase [candidate division Zixibacteria bacterium]|nr:threonine--tRNA ligase [candidate division Zixibacteria bacterium]